MTHLPDLGLGCAALAVRSPATEDDAAVELLVHAHASGVRCFDVAPLYGGGRGEVLLGRALARMDGPVTVSTKVGYVGDIPYGGRQPPEERRKDFSRGAIERSLEQSLRRLGRERVDWVFLHDPEDDLDPIEQVAWPTCGNSWLSTERRKRLKLAAASFSSAALRMTTNSSPPKRNRRSPPRKVLRMSSPMRSRTSSPNR